MIEIVQTEQELYQAQLKTSPDWARDSETKIETGQTEQEKCHAQLKTSPDWARDSKAKIETVQTEQDMSDSTKDRSWLSKRQ
jgi:hypothetical protein